MRPVQDRPGRNRPTDPSPATVLGTAVDLAIDTLTTGRSEAGARTLDTLRGALAVVAARGALCSMPAAVRTLHRAQDLIIEGDTRAAGARLTEARDLLGGGTGARAPQQRDTPATGRLLAR